MPKIPHVLSQDAIQSLERLGFTQVRQTESYVVMKMETPEDIIGCVVPIHRELKIRTLIGLIKQAQVTPEDFIDNL